MLNRRLFIGSAMASGSFALPFSRGLAAGQSDAIVPLVRHMLGTSYQALPEAALRMTRAQLFDTAGIALAARHEAGVRELRQLGTVTGGKGESAVWGSKLRLPAHEAARINAVMVHALEFDDTFGRGFLHPSAIVYPAALAAADLVGKISGQEFLAAATLANDIACRLSIAGQPGVDGFAIGWHNTTLIGYLSSALVAGRLMGLTEAQLVGAAGIAAHQAAGNAQSHVDSALTKRLGPGFASSAGVLAARLAQMGLSGPRGVLEGVKGWFSQYHKGIYSRDLLLGGLGQDYPAVETAFKPWPSCRGSHTSADAALQLIARHQLTPEQIERIEIRNGPAEWPFLSNPIEAKRRPRNVVEAQFSIPWVVAAAFTDGRVRIAQFTPQALERADIQAMAARITAVQDNALANPAGGPGQAAIVVTTKDGRRLESHVAAAKGEPQTPMTAEEVQHKFDDCLEYGGYTRAHGNRLRGLLAEIDRLDDVSRLSRLLGQQG